MAIHARGRQGLCWLTATAVLLFAAGCPGPPISDNVLLTSDLVYGRGYVGKGDGYELRDLRFDLLEPKDDPGPNKPAVLMIHGGGFDGGTKTDEDLVRTADRLATVGYVCFLVDYRLEGDDPPEAKSLEAAEPPKDLEIPSARAVHAAYVDAKVAMRHIRANAAAYGIDPDRIAAFGESAGAFAAIAAGVTDPEDYASDGPDFPVPADNNPGVDPKPQVVIDCWGGSLFVTDEFDPADPPVMIWHGLLDLTVPYLLFALEVADKCDQLGIPHRLFGLYGEDHGAWDAEFDDKDLPTHILEFLADFMPAR